MSAEPILEMTEREWQAQVVDLARTVGWSRIYHTHDSRRSAHGFPDLVLVRDRVLFVELKTEKKDSRLAPAQALWIRDLRAAGAEAYVVRPSDLQELAHVLTARWRVTDKLAASTIAEVDRVLAAPQNRAA